MPRFARIHVTGGLYHVISRFHDRNFFLDIEGARHKYLELLGKAAEKHDARIIGYCLMSSHVHLVLQIGNQQLGDLTRAVHSPFGLWVNAHRRGLGTVFADRPKSVLVHAETYGMELLRYVHNNPVRAGLVERASESVWSSYRAYLGLDECPLWLAIEAVLGPEGKERESIRAELAEFVNVGYSEPRRPEFSGEVSRELARRVRRLMGGEVELSYPVLGPDDFVVETLREQVRRHRDTQRSVRIEIGVDELSRRVFTALGIDPGLSRSRSRSSEVSRGRALVAWLWVERMGRPQVSVADGLGVRASAVSRMLGKLKREGPAADENALLDGVLEAMTEDSGIEFGQPNGEETGATQPKVLVLRRQR